MKKAFLLLWSVCLLAGAGLAGAQNAETNSFANLNRPIPDGNFAGVIDVRNVTSAIGNLASLRVRLKVAGEFNGDLYGYLRHVRGTTTNFVVLLNRVGRTATNAEGYPHAGLDVAFDNAAQNGDIHLYGAVTNLPAGSPLTGFWQPDGRNVDPDLVLDTSPRSTSLASFNGTDANGEWLLYLVDLVPGGTNALVSWQLEFSGTSIIPDLAWPTPANITYGTPLGAAQLNASSTVNGTYSYSVPAGTILNAGNNQTLSVTFFPTDTSTYQPVSKSVQINVLKAPLTVKANDAARTYGAGNPALLSTITGFVNGEVLATSGMTGTAAVTTAANAGSPVSGSPYAIVPALGTLAAANYSFNFVNGALTVNKATLNVQALSAARAYGSPNPSFGTQITGFVNGEVLATSGVTGLPSTSTTATPSSSVTGSPYPITPGVGSLLSANYTFNFVNGSLNITPVALTVRADNASRVYGAANPAFSASITGFVNGETLGTSGVTGTANFSTLATPLSGVAGSPYAITPSAGTLAAANYTFNFANGSLTVTKAPLTVTANSATRAFGALNPTFTAAISGFVNGETLATSGVTGAALVTSLATPLSGVAGSPYPIVPAAGTLASANYSFLFVNGALAVTPAVLTVTADSVSRAYGAPNPPLSATITGFVNGETLLTSGVTGAPAVTTAATPSSSVAGGPYPITPALGTLASANYGFTFANGALTVTKAALTVKANDATRPYGGANPLFTSTITGFVNGESLATSGVTGEAGFTTTATANSPVNGSPYSITPTTGTLAAGNYTFNFANGALAITKATLLVTASGGTRPYGSANPSFTTSISGFVNGETLGTSGVTGSAGVSTAATPGSSVAGSPYAVTPTLGTLAAANYGFSFANGALTVTPVQLTVKANNASRAYGASNPSFTTSITGFVNGETVATGGVTGAAAFATSAQPNSPVAGSPYTITASQGTLAAANYTFAFSGATLTVTPALLTVKANDAARAYGAANPPFGVTITGFANGEDLVSGNVTGTPQVTSLATPASSVAGGPYPIVPSLGTLVAANYSFAFANGSLTVTKAVLNVSGGSASRTYGAANPAFTATMDGFVNGETLATSGVTGAAAVTSAATPASGVAGGPYPVIPSLGTLASANYSFNFVNGMLTVTPATATVTANNASRAYGAVNPVFSATISGLVNGETLATSDITGQPNFSTTATVASLVAGGPYPIVPDAGTLASANYTFVFVNGSLSLTRTPLTVVVANATRTFGSPNPAFTGTVTGLLNGDLITANFASAATTNSLPNTYPIGFSVSDPTGKLGNYNLTGTQGTLTVTKALLTVTANSTARAFGQPNPVFTFSISGFVNGESQATSGLLGLPVLSCAANAASTVEGSPYPIVIAQGSLASAKYTFAFVNGSLTVTPPDLKVLTLTINSTSRPYGSANPPFTYTLSGFVDGDTPESNDITGAPVISTTATPSSPVTGSPYPITATLGTLTSQKYTFVFFNGALAVTKVPLTVKGDDATRVYGAANPALSATITGFVNGETLATSGVTGTASVSTAATPVSSVAGGPYAIVTSLGTLAAANYSFTFGNGALTVTKSPLTYTVANVSRAYGAANPPFTAAITGFVNGESAATAGITGVAAFDTTAAPGSSVAGSPYAVTAAAGTLAAGNYSFNFANGSLTVTQAVLNVTADSVTRAYGTANPALTATISGFANGETLGTSGVTGAPGVTTTANATSGVAGSPYPIVPTQGTLAAANYRFAFVNGSLTVEKAPLTVTAISPTRTYGTANPTLTATITGYVNGETLATSGVTGTPSVTSAATAASGVAGSPYAVTASIGTLAAANYSFAFANGLLTVTPAVLTVSTENLTRPYGSPNSTLTADMAGFVNGETLATSGVTGAPEVTTPATPASSVADSPFPVTVSQGTLAAANYTFAFVNGSLTVTKAPLTVSVNNITRTYGSANPEFVTQIQGFVNGETLGTSGVTGAPAVATSANAGSSVAGSPYVIAVEAGTLAAANYSFNFVNGTLAVTRAPLTVTASSASRTYGSANPEFTAAITGFVNSESLETSGVTGSASVTCAATPLSGVANSPYAVVVSAGTLAAANYSFGFVNGELTVTPALLTVTADNKARVYGAANPVFTSQMTGFVNGEVLASSGVTGSPSLTTSATISSGVVGSPYVIVAGQGTLSAVNYTFSFAPGELTVTQAPLSIVADNQSRLFGTPNPVFTGTITGLKNGDNITPIFGSTATLNSPVGDYEITIGIADPDSRLANYQVATTPGSLNISLAVLTTTFVSSQNPALPGEFLTFTFTASASGVGAAEVTGNVQFKVDGAQVASVPLAAGVATYSTAALQAGTHLVEAVLPTDGNYPTVTKRIVPDQVVNTPPVAGTDTVERFATLGLKISIAQLLRNDTDADGDTVAFVTANPPSTLGGGVVVSNAWIYYTPPDGFTGPDSFTYTISDGKGGTATGIVSIVIKENTAPTLNLTLTLLEGGALGLQFSGIPGRTYQVEYTESLIPPVWIPLVSAQADAFGSFQILDTPPPGTPFRFYRTIDP